MFNSIWYDLLIKPPFTPPNWVFAPVWSFMYITLAFSLFLYIKSGGIKGNTKGLALFIVQLFLNFLWTPVFFIWERIGLALGIAILMFVVSIFMIKNFFKCSKISAFLLIPYLIWLIFAIYLNAGILYLNS